MNVSKADWKLIRDGVITTDDLDGFSEDCRKTVTQLLTGNGNGGEP